MNARLDYPSGQSFTQYLTEFKAKVNNSAHGKRVHISFAEKDSRIYLSFSLPTEKARQLANAILAAASGDLTQPIEFAVDESTKSVAA